MSSTSDQKHLDSSEFLKALPGPSRQSSTSSSSTTARISPNTAQSRRGSSTKARPRVNVNHTSLNTNIIFSPRPYESLYSERAYLSYSLQLQSARAAELMQQYSLIGDQLQTVDTGKERKKLNKKLGSLKHKLNQAVEQQKAIISRLGELFVESQSRDTWAQVAQQHMISQPDLHLGVLPLYSPTSPVSCDVYSPTSSLNESTPDFVPMGYFPSPWQMSEGPLGYDEGYVVSNLDTVPEISEDTLHDEGYHNSPELNTPETEALSVIVNKEKEDTNVQTASSVKAKRLSLPCPQFMWPEE